MVRVSTRPGATGCSRVRKLLACKRLQTCSLVTWPSPKSRGGAWGTGSLDLVLQLAGMLVRAPPPCGRGGWDEDGLCVHLS